MKKYIFIHETRFGTDVYLFQSSLSESELIKMHGEVIYLLGIDFDFTRDTGTITETDGEFNRIIL